MKFLKIGDLHADTVNPQSRIDSYFQAFKNKIDKISEVLKSDPKCAVIFTGDFFNKKDSSRVPYRLFGLVREWLKEIIYPDGTLRSVIMIYGNHDKRSGQIEDQDNQPLFQLMRLFNIYVGHSFFDERYLPTEFGNDARILAFDHSYDFDSPEFDFVAFRDRVNKAFIPYGNKHRILLLHQAVHPSNFSYPYFTRNLKMFKDFDIDLLLAGHIHDDLGIVEFASNKFFVNVGSVMRGSIHEYNLIRTPKVCYVQGAVSSGKKEYTFAQVPLTDVDSSEIFDLEALKASKLVEKELAKFAEFLNTQSVESVGSVLDTGLLTSEQKKFFDAYYSTVGSKKENRRLVVSEELGYSPFE